MRYHLIPVRVANYQKRQALTNAGKDVENRKPLYILVRM